MDIVTFVLALLFAVLASQWIIQFLPVPLPFAQILLGIVLAVTPLPSADLEPDIFFLVFLPPLLFLDGWRIPKRDLFRDGATILALAFGLVFFTVAGLGFFIHWLIPAMPLAVTFALAAVLSPTDPVAVSAVASRIPMPKRLMHILEGEALLNDASGLVCLRFAVTAALTGTFSLKEASLQFVWLGAGGAATGIGVTFAVTYLEDLLLRRSAEDPGAKTLFSLLIPFGVYLLAESIHVSGILAVVASGITMTYVENRGRALALTRMRRSAVWDTVQLAANGAIFVLLGEQLPGIFKNAIQAVSAGEKHGAWWLALYVIVIMAALVVMRFVWVFVTLRMVLIKARIKGERPEGLTWHLVAVTSLAGVKGAITLAGILTLPEHMPGGAPFPERDLAIFLAMGAILLSLASAAVTLPVLLPHLRLPPEPSQDAEEDEARGLAGQSAVQAIEGLLLELDPGSGEEAMLAEAASRAMERYQRRRPELSEDLEARQRGLALRKMEKRLRLAGLKAERDALYQLRRNRGIEDGLLRRLVREVDLLEARYSSLRD